MDRISQLSDTLLLRILSELPTAEVVETMVLSKRWLPLWKSVPHIDFDDDSYEDIDTGRFSRFVDRSLILHKAPIETLHFELTQSSTVDDIGVWIEMAVQRHVRDLSIYIDCTSSTTPVTVPRSLYTGCGMLVTLKLKSVTLADASTLPSFSTLKYLFLLFVKYPGEEFVRRLLFSCGVLEHLDVEQCFDDNVTIFTVKVPSLKSAILRKSKDRYIDDEDGFVIDAPSLELLDVYNSTAGFCTIESAMPNIVKANVVVNHGPSEILSAITSVKRLYLCLSYAKLSCIRDEQRSCWNEPSSVPACLLSSLETFEWVNYEGTEEEKKVVAFILRSGRCLKKVNISSETTDSDKKLEIL
ncbi:hypothetical protein YC2023_022104 [Brassica napus]